MLDFMDYIQQAFFNSSQWNQDNSYSNLTATAQSLLNFSTPRGLRMNICSLATPHLSTSYNLSLTGPVSGSISYLFSSLPLNIASRSSQIPLASLIRGYRHVLPPRPAEDERFWEIWHRGRRVDKRDTLLYGRMFLPASRLEALYLRRTAPTRMLQIRGVSDSGLPNGGSVLGVLHSDNGKYSTDYLFSTDSALLGVRGLYNFGPDPRETAAPSAANVVAPVTDSKLSIPSLFSLGFEAYYGLLNKSGGLSTGIRFTTLPSHTSFPYTMTLTLNPLMGNLSSTYSVKAGRYLAFCSQFDWNFYSYESGVMVGCELWRLRRKPETVLEKLEPQPSVSTTDDFLSPAIENLVEPANSQIIPPSAKLIPGLVHGFPHQAPDDDDVAGVLKAKIDQDWKIGLLWEGRFKELLFSVGASLDLKRRERVISGIRV